VRGKHVLLSLGNPNDRPFVKVIKVGADVAFSLETEDPLIAEARQANRPPAALIPGDADTAMELFGTGDLTAAVNALPADLYSVLERRFGLLADWVLIGQRINLAREDRQSFLRLVGTAALDDAG
jgi:hypothetical protein